MAKHYRHSICIAVFLKRNDSIALELNKSFLLHLKTGARLFLALVLQASNL